MMVHFSTQGFWDADYYYEPFHCTQNNNIRGTIRGTTCHLHTGNGNIWLEIPVGFVNRYDCGVVPPNSNPPVSGLSRLSRTC